MSKEEQIHSVARLAQFLFDNAETIIEELRKSSSYRAFHVEFLMHKRMQAQPNLKLALSIYDEKTTHYKLSDNAATDIQSFMALCRQMNKETCDTSPPKLLEVREEL